MSETDLIRQFHEDPETGYQMLLDRFTPIMLRMARRFMRDEDEVMEVYTAVCERLSANEYDALRRFRADSEILPWMGVVVANACRDRFRKRRAKSVPRSVLKKLDEREKLVFKYYYRQRLTHSAIAEMVSTQDGIPCTRYDVARALEKIEEMLTVSKRWHLLSALYVNQTTLSLDELSEDGFPVVADDQVLMDEQMRQKESLDQLDEAVRNLEEDDQRLLALRYECGMKAAEIAEVMRYDNHKYVYTRLRTVVNRLRRMMGASA